MKNRTNIHCLALITCAFVLMQSSYASAQVKYSDSLRIENDRSILSAQLVLLRDSIKETIAIVDQVSKKNLPKNAEKIKVLSKELKENKEQLDKIVDEISTTSQNSWSETSVKRIRLTAQSIRGYYKTEKNKYARLVKQKKRTRLNE
jgi:hypothetical protein